MIPEQVRLPAYIVIIAGLVTLVSLVLQAYIPALYNSLGLFLSLITVNCIILGRAEMFASKNKPVASVIDGLGMGLGFTFALTLIGAVREVLGAGKVFGIPLYDVSVTPPMVLFILPAGGFFTLAVCIALMNYIKGKNARDIGGCAGCDGCASCGGGDSGDSDNATVADKA